MYICGLRLRSRHHNSCVRGNIRRYVDCRWQTNDGRIDSLLYYQTPPSSSPLPLPALKSEKHLTLFAVEDLQTHHITQRWTCPIWPIHQRPANVRLSRVPSHRSCREKTILTLVAPPSVEAARVWPIIRMAACWPAVGSRICLVAGLRTEVLAVAARRFNCLMADMFVWRVCCGTEKRSQDIACR